MEDPFLVSNPIVCIAGLNFDKDSAGWIEAIVEVGEAGVVGGCTITPAARTSEVADRVDCEVRLNEAKGEGGFESDFVEEDPAMVVF